MGFFDFFKGTPKHSNGSHNERVGTCSTCINDAVVTCSGCSKEYCEDCLIELYDSGIFYCGDEVCLQKCNQAVADNKRKQLHKEAEELLSKPNIIIKEYISKYLNGKEQDFKIVVNHIVEREDIFNPIVLESPASLFLALQMSYSHRLENSTDIDSQLQIEGLSDHTKELASDIVMLREILSKKGVSLNNYQFLFTMNYLIDQELTDTVEPIINPAYNIISKKTTTDKKAIIKEFLILQDSQDGNEFFVKKLLEKFNLSCTTNEILDIIDQCKNELELEEFEKNLGVKKEKKIADDFDELDGYQFENYAKNLFKLLGYDSITTKLSNDQGADLIISKNNIKTVVQCKHYKDPVANKAIQEVVAAKNHYGCNEALVLCTSSFTKSAIELAKSNKVELWDREKLKQAITDINKEHKKESRFHSEQTSEIVNGSEGLSIPASCPYCNHEFQLNLNEIPRKNNKVNISCPDCAIGLNIRSPDSYFECEKCKLSFDTISDKINHEKSCKTVK